MSTWSRWLCLVASTISLACGDDSGDGSEGGGSTTTASGTSAATSTTTSSTAATTSGATASGGGTNATATSTATAGSTTAGTTAGGLCDPNPDDSACIACIKPGCCDVLTACRNDAICTCTLDCVLEGNSLGSCRAPCGGENDLYQAVFFCGQMSCLGTCDWNCC